MGKDAGPTGRDVGAGAGGGGSGGQGSSSEVSSSTIDTLGGNRGAGRGGGTEQGLRESSAEKHLSIKDCWNGGSRSNNPAGRPGILAQSPLPGLLCLTPAHASYMCSGFGGARSSNHTLRRSTSLRGVCQSPSFPCQCRSVSFPDTAGLVLASVFRFPQSVIFSHESFTWSGFLAFTFWSGTLVSGIWLLDSGLWDCGLWYSGSGSTALTTPTTLSTTVNSALQ